MARAVFLALSLTLALVGEAKRTEIAVSANLEAHTDGVEAINGTSDSQGKCCKKCSQNAGCMHCTKKYLGYILAANGGVIPASEGGDASKLEQFVMTTKFGQQIKIALPTQKFAGEGGSRNCFAYATHQSYQIPAQTPELVKEYGNSPILRPHEVSDEGLHEAMNREEAIFIGRTSDMLKATLSKELPIVEGRSYYIVSVLVTPGEEYHFWGLWSNGWYCVSSKISSVAQDLGYFATPERQCPSGSIFTLMKAKNPKYHPDLGGFWLFPCREESCW